MPSSGLLRAFVAAAFTLAAIPCAHASVTVLVGEPFGSFGTMMPTGHTSIYLDRVCADGPLKVRMCAPGEPAGVAVARLDAIGKVDWVVSPILEFLYGVEDPADILPYASASEIDALRQSYRRRTLSDLLPDGSERKAVNKDWWEMVGVAYNRRLWGYQLATTPEQDARLVAKLNAEVNLHQYHLHKVNCADFAADLINFFYPGTVKDNKVADFDLMTPKQVARAVSAYGHAHPEAQLKVFEVPQVPGSVVRSRPVRGGSEMLLKTKRYLFTLLVIQPEVVAALVALYLDRGRWDLGRGFEVAGPQMFAGTAGTLLAEQPAVAAPADSSN